MKIHELFASPESWTQGVSARDKDGDPVYITDDRACSWCLSGALYKCYRSPEELHKAAAKLYEHIDGIISFNDSGTYEEVLALVKKLDI